METNDIKSITYDEESMKVENLKNGDSMKMTMVSNEVTP